MDRCDASKSKDCRLGVTERVLWSRDDTKMDKYRPPRGLHLLPSAARGEGLVLPCPQQKGRQIGGRTVGQVDGGREGLGRLFG